MSNNKILLAGNFVTHKGVIFSASGNFCNLEGQKEIDLTFLYERGYTLLHFSDGEFIIFPLSRLPKGIGEGDSIEMIVIRRKHE